jgi:predicted metal-binding membrane protein
MAEAAIETVLKRDRMVVVTALGAVTLLAWVYVIHLALQMEMGGMDMTGFRMAVAAASMVMRPAFEPWTTAEFVFTFAMWAVMMIGMMTPSVAPIVLLYARVARQAATDGKTFAPTAWFFSGYVLIWIGFSLLATFAQWVLDRTAMLTSTMSSRNALLGAGVLIVCGVYQWSSLKDQCLKHCQSPMHFIQQHGGFGRTPFASLQLGISHGLYCVGCCWALMALLFFGGVMNVLWVASIAIFVLAEKVIRTRYLIPRLAGLICISGGLFLLLHRS